MHLCTGNSGVGYYRATDEAKKCTIGEIQSKNIVEEKAE